MSDPGDKKAFKDWFDAGAARRLGGQVQNVWPEFPTDRFVARATRGLHELEFHGRIHQFADALAECLPPAPAEAIGILQRSLPPGNPGEDSISGGWLQWPLGHVIATRGLNDFEISFRFMTELTQRFSSEFAVRPFVELKPQKTFAALLRLTPHKNPHVRRWCSEGIRPRLPWGKRLDALVADPSPLWPILEALNDDSSAYVRTSVANCLNDIAKDHPDLLLARLESWAEGAGPERTWIIRRALRTLIKDGNPRALTLLGYQPDPSVDAVLRLSAKQIALGETVVAEAILSNPQSRPQPLLIDFVVQFPGKAGGLREKVFKWTTLTLAAGETRILRKTIPLFKPTTIRALYPGEHLLQLQLNGTRQGRATLVLKPHEPA